jgi:Zn-dependent protease
MSFGPINWTLVIEMIIILLISIDVHELAHAVVADRMGDPTPRRMGELSLNPFVHMDQIGVLLLVLTSVTVLGFTYGRTHVTPTNLKFGPQRGNAIVALAGPVSNILLAGLAGVVLTLYGSELVAQNYQIANFVANLLLINVLLFVLNLLPVPPLDGFSILGGFLSARQMYSLAPVQQWGPIVLLLLFVTDPQTHILSNIIQGPTFSIVHILCSQCA